MIDGASVAVTIAVIAVANDVQQPAVRSATRIIVGREEASRGIKCESEEIPDTPRPMHETAAFIIQAKDASLIRALEHRAVASCERPRSAVIFTEAEVQNPIRPSRDSGEAVVRILVIG